MNPPQDQTQAEELARKFANCENELCTTCPANAELIDQYANQRALKLLDELTDELHKFTAEHDAPMRDEMLLMIHAKRLNLTKETE